MSRPDAAATTALQQERYLRPILFAWMDFVGDEVRINNSGQNITVSGTTLPNLNGTFLGATPEVVDLSPIVVSEGGSGQVTATLSGIKEYDADLINLLHDRSKWKGRMCRIWRLVRDGNNVDRGNFQHLHTCYMVDVSFPMAEDGTETIEVVMENYLVTFAQPSNRTYLEQELYDPGDLSARATVAAVNGRQKSGGSVGGSGGGSVGGGGGGGSGTGRTLRVHL